MTSKKEKRNKRYESVVFSDAFYKTIKVLNEELCQQNNKPRSIHNANQIITVLLPPSSAPKDSIISSKTYNYLFDALRTQLDYNKTDWVYQYWQSASQYYAENNNNNDEFREFHLWLATMVLYRKEYDLLGKLLSFSQSVPTRYPLVPSFFSDIVDSFIKINEKMNNDPITYDSYSFSDTDGVRRESIQQGSMSNLLALLLFRLNSFDVAMMRNKGIWNKPQLPKELRELNNLKEHIEVLQRFVERWDENREYEAIKVFKIIPEREKENNPVGKLEKLISDIENEINKPKENSELDKTKDISEHPEENAEDETPNSKASIRGDKEANNDMQQSNDFKKLLAKYLNILNLPEYNLNYKYQTLYLFHLENAFKAIEKLISENKDKFFVICFGNQLGLMTDHKNTKVEGLTKERDDLYIYNGIEIQTFENTVKTNPPDIFIVLAKKERCKIKSNLVELEELLAKNFKESNKKGNDPNLLYIYNTPTPNASSTITTLKNEENNENNVNIPYKTRELRQHIVKTIMDKKLAEIIILNENIESKVESKLKDVTPLPLPKEEEK